MGRYTPSLRRFRDHSENDSIFVVSRSLPLSCSVLQTPPARAATVPSSIAPAGPSKYLLLLALLLAVQISALWYPTPDASGYLSIARSLAAGTGPTNLGSRQLYLAPGYPVLISPAFLLADEPFLVLSVIHWSLAVALMLGVYVWARRHLPAAALLLTAVVMVNVELWSLLRRTLSETAFMTLLVWEINLLHWAANAVSTRVALARTALAALGMAALALTRQAGLMIAAGFGVAMLLQAYRGQVSRSRAFIVTLSVGLPAALAVAGLARLDRVMAAASGSATYVDQMVDPSLPWVDQLGEGLRLRISEVGRLTIPGMFKAYARRGDWLNVNMAVYLPLAVLLLVGWAKWLRRTGDVFALTLPFYLGLYIIWPFDQATRFTVPMLPLLLACIWSALERLGRYRVGIFRALWVGHLAAALGYWLVIDLPRAWEDGTQWPAVRQMAAVLCADQGPVLAAEVPTDTQWMLQFALDRRVREQSPGTAIEAEIRWIVTTNAAARFAGFVPHVQAGNYHVLCRETAPGMPTLARENKKPSFPPRVSGDGEEGLTARHEPITARVR